MPADPATNRSHASRPETAAPSNERSASVAYPPLLRDPGGVHRTLWIVCILLLVATFATGGVVIWRLHVNALASAQQEMTNLGAVLAEQTSRSIQSVDLVLQEVQSRVADMGIHTPEQFRLQLGGDATHQFLASRLQNLPQAETLSLVDAKGLLLNWAREEPVPALDIADRDYFLQLRDHNSSEVVISGASTGRITGRWFLFVVRRVAGPDGVFLGLVAGLIDTDYLEDFYHTISMLPGESVTVLRRDGVVVAGQPDIDSRRGKKVPDRSPWYRQVAAGGGAYRSSDYLGMSPTIITVHPLRDYPLVVDVNVTEEAAFKDWYQQTIGIVIAMISVALGCVTLFAVIAAQFRRQAEQHARLLQTAAALHKSEGRLKAFAEMSADWFWEQDADLRFVRDSGIPLTSLPTDVGKTRWDFADSAMSPDRWESHKADLAARRPFRDFRWERIRTDGKRGYMSTSGDPIFDEAGVFLGYHGTGRDMTADVEAAEELRRSKEQAEAASRAKSEFLANMSHELRTPLNAIIGFAQLIQNQKPGQSWDKYAEWAGDILSSGQHLLDVINDVLELSRIEAGRYDLADDRVDLAVVARSCLGMIRLQAADRDVQLNCVLTEPDAVLCADLRAVKQVVINLLNNAVKFASGGGTVSLRTERAANGDLVLVVADTGIGIDPAALASLCEPFTQADASISRRYGGTGLGLAISRKLVNLHGGSLTIESAPGVGTTVRVSFPAVRIITDQANATLPAEPLGAAPAR